MLSCKEATELISQGMDRKLSFGERMGLRLHYVICVGCRATRGHLEFLQTATRTWRQHQDSTHPQPSKEQ